MEPLSEASPARANALSIALRILIGGTIFGFLVLRDPRPLLDALGAAKPSWVIAAAGVLLCGIVVSALRWKAYIDALELSIPFPALLRLYFVGTFFNAFLPTGIGGDAYKAVRIGRARDNRPSAVASVFLDRFAGVVGLAVIGLAGVLWQLLDPDIDRRVAAAALVLSGSILAAALILLLGGERLLGRGRLIKEHGVGGAIRRAVRAIHTAARHPVAAARGYALGLAFQLLVLTYHLLIARALPGVGRISVGAMAGVVVISSIAVLVPVTINGLGFREGAYVWALGTLGVARGDARAFAVLVLAILLATSAIGGLVYVIAGGEVASKR